MNYGLAQQVVRYLGGDWHGDYGLAPGLGHSKRDRSLKIKAHPSDLGEVVIHSFTGENWRDLKDELRRKGVLPAKDFQGTRPPDPAAAVFARARREEAERQAAADAVRRGELAQSLWDRSEPAEGSVVQTYLRWRGIVLDALPVTIRYLRPDPPKHPHAAMLAAFGIAYEPEPGRLGISARRIKGVHLTFLAPDGKGKASVEPQRKMLGCSNGWPICLAAPNDSLGLFIGEGIETSLWGQRTTGLGCWAAGDANRLPALADKVPGYIESVSIAEDADPAGERHTVQLAERLRARGFEVCTVRCGHGA